MAADSDEALKRELIAEVGEVVNFDSGGGEAYLRVFPDGSTEDQKPWEDGGLTFTHGGLSFGSNDAAYYIANSPEYPIMAWELTDGLNRGNSGNAQYQRFHHALGAVRNGIIGIYFLKEGQSPVLPDLYKMALSAWEIHGTPYIISQDWQECKKILELWDDKHQLENHLHSIRSKMQKIFDDSFYHRYKGDWATFARKRSTIIPKMFDTGVTERVPSINPGFIIKHSGRWVKNFTDGSQRAGHIAVGEMYLSLYFFPHSHLYYLWPKMTQEELDFLNRTKKDDKEWSLLSGEERVTIVTRDDIVGLPIDIVRKLASVSHLPGKGDALKTYNHCVKFIVNGLSDGSLSLRHFDHPPGGY